jgi:hypothetical protein
MLLVRESLLGPEVPGIPIPWGKDSPNKWNEKGFSFQRTLNDPKN